MFSGSSFQQLRLHSQIEGSWYVFVFFFLKNLESCVKRSSIRMIFSISFTYWDQFDSLFFQSFPFPLFHFPWAFISQSEQTNQSFLLFWKTFFDWLVFGLRLKGISNRVDESSASIGKRYARNDELGTPYGITIDFQTLDDGTVTLRERDSTRQIRDSVSLILSGFFIYFWMSD